MGKFDEKLTPSEKVIVYNDRIDKLKKLKRSLDFDSIALSEIPNDTINEKGQTVQEVINSLKKCFDDRMEEFISEQRILLNNLFKG